MELNEIKKALYKEKPLAKVITETNEHKGYVCGLENGATVYFHVPLSEMGENEFDDEISAQLLIRWIHQE